MTRDQELREESEFCRRSAEDARDPSYRRALIELADWWEGQADYATSPSLAGGHVFHTGSTPGIHERAAPTGGRIK